MKRIPYYVLVFLSTAVSVYAAIAYGLFKPGALVHPDMRASFELHAWALRLHVFAAIVALALGPLQFSATLRTRRPGLHRVIGRAYLGVGVTTGGLSGLYIAQFAYGGAMARTGFTMLALAWLYTGVQGYLAIRRRDVARHREWMARNFSLTFAAVTLRIYLPSSMLAGIPFEAAYPVIAWLCWVPNLVLASAWIARRRRLEAAVRRAPAPIVHFT